MNEPSAFSLENRVGKFGLSAFVLKTIALVTMIIDHVGAVLYPGTVEFRIIGRLAFPIYCFLIAEGFFHTKDVKKYELRLLMFALLSEIPFDLAMTGTWLEFGHQNVFFTLLFGLFLMDVYSRQVSTSEKIFCVLAVTTMGDLMHIDYGSWGILMIFCFFVFRERFLAKLISVSGIQILAFGGIQCYGALSFVPIALYNGKKGPGFKYFFYLMYPVHLLILYLLRFLT